MAQRSAAPSASDSARRPRRKPERKATAAMDAVGGEVRCLKRKLLGLVWTPKPAIYPSFPHLTRSPLSRPIGVASAPRPSCDHRRQRAPPPPSTSRPPPATLHPDKFPVVLTGDLAAFRSTKIHEASVPDSASSTTTTPAAKKFEPKYHLIKEICTEATLRSVRCNAAQTQSVQRKSSTATVKRSDPKGKVQGPKLDDGSGGFPPFRFGKGGGGGGGDGGGSNYFGGFLLFTIVLLLDYLKEFEKNLLARRHHGGDDADDVSNGLLEQ